MGKYTPLVQSEFQMRLVKDLGFRYMSEVAKRKTRRAIFECSRCEKHFEGNPFVIRLRGQKYCASCAVTIGNTKELDKSKVKGNILADLGIENGRRYVLAECLVCRASFRARLDRLNESDECKCRSCSYVGRHKIHGESRNRIYSIYQNMKSRCLKGYATGYENYGGRGISICQEWQDSFEVFRDWAMANGYKEGLTIDRRDNDGNYEPSNCRWVTMDIQAQNQRERSNLSGYTGVYLDKRDGIYSVNLQVNGKTISLGRFSNAKDGAMARDKYITQHNLEHTKNFKS